MVAVRRALPQHEAQHHGTKTIAAAQNVMPQHKEYGCGSNTKHQHCQDCFGLLWKVSGCHGLLVTMTPFPHVTANA